MLADGRVLEILALVAQFLRMGSPAARARAARSLRALRARRATPQSGVTGTRSFWLNSRTG
ncbi:hypothetical protein SPURM210S_04316 [Streptomyces purpurascens]